MTQKNSSLIIGADGTLGRALKEHINSHKEPAIETTRRKETCTSSRICLDLSSDIDDTWSPPAGVSVAYLCAAVTSSEKCFQDPARSAQVNVHNTIKIAKRCLENDVF